MKKITIVFTALALSLSLCACSPSGTAEGGSSAEPELTYQDYYDLGVRYLSEGNYEEAILAFTAAIEIDPKQAPAYVGRGDAYVLSGETDQNLAAAKADYEKAIGLDEAIAEAYLGLAGVYIRQGNIEKALEVLQEGLEKTGGSQKISGMITELTYDGSSNNADDRYGFTARNAFHDFDSLTSEEQVLIEQAAAIAINQGGGDWPELARRIRAGGDSSSFLLSNGYALDYAVTFATLYTIWNEYKIELTATWSDDAQYQQIEIEMRPENGTGYHFDFNTEGDEEWAFCHCSDWQWNGVATIKNDRWEITGELKDNLRTGTFTWLFYSDGDTVMSSYQEGIRIEFDGEASIQDGWFYGINGLSCSSSTDSFYW